MKEIIRKSLKQLVSDKPLFVLVIVMLLQIILFAIIVGLSIHYNGRQLISHYSAFGGTQFYLDQWFYLFVFVAFGLIVAVINASISIKLLTTKGHALSVAYTWFSIGIVLIGWVMASRILELQALL
jgi:hypothetical protein